MFWEGQYRLHSDSPFEDAKKPRSDSQFASWLPSSKCAGSKGSAAIGASATSYPPSEAWVGGTTQGAGEQMTTVELTSTGAEVAPFVWPIAQTEADSRTARSPT